MRRLLGSGVGLVVLLWGADTSAANWAEPSGGSLNADTTLQADSASIAVVGTTPYVAWEEVDASARSLIRVKRLEGTAWAAVGGPLNVSTSRDGYSPSLASVGDIPYVAWEEYDGSHFQVRVKRLEAGSWTAVGDSLNVSTSRDAGAPSIASVGGVPYVTWHESDGANDQIRVKRLDGAAWQAVGGSLNVSSTMSGRSPGIADVGGVPYVAWQEEDGIAAQIRVARLEGSAWVAVGGSLNVAATQDADRPRIASLGGLPYVVWPEDAASKNAIHVRRLEAGTWNLVGGPIAAAPDHVVGSPSIAAVGDKPVVVWEEQFDHAQVHAARFDGSNWAPVGGALNVSTDFVAAYPSIASVGGVPYVSWDEYDSATSRQIRVRRLDPDIVSQSATPTATGATLAAQVDDFGLALSVAFEYGATAAFGTATPLQTTTGAGTSTVTQTVAGLTPSTAYSFRAFGSDGVRQTALGATQSFTTLAVAGPPAGIGKITKMALKPARFVAAARGRSVVAAAAKGTVVTYEDSEAATTTFTVQRRAAGRRRGTRCVKARRRPPKAKRCTRYVKVGTFRHADAAGPNRLRFTGRVRGRKLKPGAYRLRAVPRTAAGSGKAVARPFRIKRR
jgi:hypothetical protein